jgi:catechol 2,3-dioxygenase-like lactoylglutathione lyase family enzyme
MKTMLACTALALTLTGAAMAQNAPARPKLTGISHLAVYAADPAAADKYYTQIIGAAKVADPENPQGVRYAISPVQFIEVLPLPAGAGINRMDHIAFNTESAEGMRKYLSAKAWKTPATVTKLADGSKSLTVVDPEGNKVEFVEPPMHPKEIAAPRAIGRHIIHVGILVHNRMVEDTFYRDLLGFRPYWFGGMQDDKVDWVSQQLPDSRDWLEYMLTSGPSGSGIPANMSQHNLGVLNHFSIGEHSVDDAYKTMVAEHRLECIHDEGPKMGKDGKVQFNLYDPDHTRTELMNFRATEKPCCSAFTAEDPAE